MNASRLNSANPVLGIALDMDGLLFDTERLYWQVGDELLKRRGYRFSQELQTRMMGRVGVAAMQQMIEMHQLPIAADRLLCESDEIYSGLIADGVPPMPGLNRWIDRLIASGLPFGLATSSSQKHVDVILGTVAWSDALAFVLSGDDVTHGKPHPEMYLAAAQRMQIVPQQMLVLEDSGNGCAAAVAAGAQTVAIPNENTREQTFDGAVLIADSLNDPRLWDLLPG
ncbi:HAD family hydrolase [Novipirellula artificiosorum]|uniref:Phosphorylated carbohydrates phosphatase n=1 Tax=Novipirellula artificiosorum TaxID=2528016 RepID=A0A5C6DYW0_9BACT|nr:HAD-IA family hydrolase [Novipirellula artificiosorum]TWU41027.1 Phosphorylated carbohydrates phosphatase [Novipirellula artificiosorum]